VQFPTQLSGAAPAKTPDPITSTPAGSVSLPAGKWARYAAKLGGALTVTASAAMIRSGGHEPNQPDDGDVDLMVDALEEGLRVRFGDGPVPWWMGAALAAGGVYAGMRIGAKKLEGGDRQAIKPGVQQPAEHASPLSPKMPPSIPPIGSK